LAAIVATFVLIRHFGCAPSAAAQPESAAQEYDAEIRCRDVFWNGQTADFAPIVRTETLAPGHATEPMCDRWLPIVVRKRRIGYQMISWFFNSDGSESCVTTTRYKDPQRPTRVCVGTYRKRSEP
jgi:hypothetical protein